MPDLATVMGRFGVAKLSELVSEDTLSVMTAAFRVRVTAPALISILRKRHGTDLLRSSDQELSFRAFRCGRSRICVGWACKRKLVCKILLRGAVGQKF